MNTPERVQRVLTSPDKSLRDAIQLMDSGGMGILLIGDEAGKLLGVVTDGDFRRAILQELALDSPISAIMSADPLVYHGPVTNSEALRLMNEGRSFLINHLPIVDDQGKVVDIILRSDLSSERSLPVTAVVMAGGYGTRLRPLTEELPKPMLPVGDRPLLELIIEQLRRTGVRQLNLTTHHKAKVITQHFGDGRDFGVGITYIEEDRPLGTAGALRLVKVSDEPLLVINGDILTNIDFRAMLDFHREQQAEMTIAVREHEFPVPYGIVHTEGMVVTGISEKPVVRHFINAGIYLLDSGLCRFIPEAQPYDMPDLISKLLTEGRRVVSFPVREYWLDIGGIEDYRKAVLDVEKGEV